MNDLDLRALSVWCPLCWAPPHKPCISTATIRVVNKVPHVARLEAYERTKENAS